VLREKSIALNSHIVNKTSFENYNLSFHLTELERKEIKPRATRKKLMNIQAENNEPGIEN
jgi:hypothetical protein